jgi:5-hydroxyisourate hydrolase-like protein (transthyretin family)
MKLKIFLVFALLVFKTFNATAQNSSATLSGLIKDKTTKSPLPYINVVLKTAKDQKMLFGTLTNEEGRFNLTNVATGNYTLEITAVGYKTKSQKIFVGTLSDFLDLNTIELEEDINTLSEVVVTSKSSEVSAKMDKKVFSVYR